LTVPFLDLARQVGSIRDELDETIADVVRSGTFVLGRHVRHFEQAFACYCGAQHAVGVASGTNAIGIALEAVGVRPGDEVITAANTSVATVVGIEQCGATPVLVDVERDSYTLDPSLIDAAVGERTRAIVPVHLYGQCADMERVLAVARRHGLKVVEDAAQAHGARFRERRAGTLGDAAAFSFYPTKNLGALGDGGAVVTNDAAVAEEVKMLRNYGERERHTSLRRGRNSRLDELQAAVLARKLAHLDGWNERRREIAARYAEGLAGSGVGLPVEREERFHVYHLFVVSMPDRDRFRDALRPGIETLVHYPRPIHRQPAYEALAPPNAAVSESLADRIVSLPLFPELDDREVEAVVAAVRDATTTP
jgi:dTDP-4-amino-4,6-dideoxygalactose transaminase